MPRCNDLSLVIEEHKSGQTAARYVLFELLRLRAALLALDEYHLAKSVCYLSVRFRFTSESLARPSEWGIDVDENELLLGSSGLERLVQAPRWFASLEQGEDSHGWLLSCRSSGSYRSSSPQLLTAGR